MNFFKLFPFLNFLLAVFNSSFFYVDDQGGVGVDVDDQSADESNNDDNKDQESTSRSDDRVKHDLYRYKSDNKTLKAKLEKAEATIKEQEKNKLIEQNRWKEAYEKELEERKLLETKLDSTVNSYGESYKIEALEKEAIKQGMDPDFLKFISNYDTSDLAVETDSFGKKKVPGAKDFIESLKATEPKLFKTLKDPSINNAGGGNNFTSGSVITYQELMKFSKSDPQKYASLHSDIKSGKITLKR
jgi:hypothetical protein